MDTRIGTVIAGMFVLAAAACTSSVSQDTTGATGGAAASGGAGTGGTPASGGAGGGTGGAAGCGTPGHAHFSPVGYQTGSPVDALFVPTFRVLPRKGGGVIVFANMVWPPSSGTSPFGCAASWSAGLNDGDTVAFAGGLSDDGTCDWSILLGASSDASQPARWNASAIDAGAAFGGATSASSTTSAADAHLVIVDASGAKLLDVTAPATSDYDFVNFFQVDDVPGAAGDVLVTGRALNGGAPGFSAPSAACARAPSSDADSGGEALLFVLLSPGPNGTIATCAYRKDYYGSPGGTGPFFNERPTSGCIWNGTIHYAGWLLDNPMIPNHPVIGTLKVDLSGPVTTQDFPAPQGNPDSLFARCSSNGALFAGQLTDTAAPDPDFVWTSGFVTSPASFNRIQGAFSVSAVEVLGDHFVVGGSVDVAPAQKAFFAAVAAGGTPIKQTTFMNGETRVQSIAVRSQDVVMAVTTNDYTGTVSLLHFDRCLSLLE